MELALPGSSMPLSSEELIEYEGYLASQMTIWDYVKFR